MKRDLYIDFAKGCATLAIIFIHTAFWSGQFYIPTEVRVLSLLFDVPVFFALSGLTSGYNVEKTLYRLLKLQITYMIFVTALFFADYFFKVFGLNVFGSAAMEELYTTFGSKYVPTGISQYPQWQNLGNWYLHQYTNADSFPVVMGSFWYLKVYYILTVLGVLVLRFFPAHIKWFIALCFGLTVFFNVFPQYYPSGQAGYVAFYLGLFLLAHQMKGTRLPKAIVFTLYGLFFSVLAGILFTWGKEYLMTMNKAKFPPKLLYIFWSSFSLITIFALYNRLKIKSESLITYVGQNAIFFYFAQGISSSLVYFAVNQLKDSLPWFVLMIIIYIINVILAVAIAVLLKKVDGFGWNVLETLRRKTAQQRR